MVPAAIFLRAMAAFPVPPQYWFHAEFESRIRALLELGGLLESMQLFNMSSLRARFQRRNDYGSRFPFLRLYVLAKVFEQHRRFDS